MNSGLPEGSIISPQTFNVCYVRALKRMGVRELPNDSNEWVPDVVYYIIFADDLTLFPCNFGNLTRVANELSLCLDPFDMCVN